MGSSSAVPRPLLFDAVLFDLDGTLVATDRFWVQAARTGARRAFDALGLEHEMPSADAWMSLVGGPLDAGFRRLFPALDDGSRRAVQAACVEEEHRLLDAGGAAWMPGAEAALGVLRAAGVRMGAASNCSSAYLEHMLGVLGIGAYLEEGRCLDSRGIANKADMLDDLLATFDTRSAVFVGDRLSDRDAAWSVGLPHLHCAFGFAPRDESIEAQATLLDLGELVPTLARRADWIERALERVGLFLPVHAPPCVVGVTGPPLAGKSLFARDAVRRLRARGIAAGWASSELWHRERAAEDEGLDPLCGLDLAALERELLAPHAAGEALAFERPGRDPRGFPAPVAVDVPARSVLFLEGEALLDPRLSGWLDRTLWLEVPEGELLRRAAGRDGRAFGPEPLERLRGTRLPAVREHARRYPPARLADLVLQAENPLGAC